MRTKTTKTTATTAFSYEDNGIGQSLREQLETSAAHIFDLGRRTTEQTFELGDHLAQAADLLADGRFDKWVKMRCGLAPRSARNYTAVFRNLTPYRDDLVDLSVGATVLFHLSSATTDQVKAAIAFAEENGRLQVADVKAILAGGEEGGDKPEKDDQFQLGGVGGLKALIAIKSREGLKAFVTHVAAICQAIEAALAKPRVIKEALAREVEDLARVARLELESLAQFVEPDSDLRRHPRSTQFPKKSEWAVVNETLQKLGLFDVWPKSKDLPGWLRNEVVPVLDWAISTDRKPKWPLVEQRALAAEQAAPVEADSVVDRQDAASDVSSEVPSEVDDSDERIERFGAALEEATGGFMTASREVPRNRKPFAKVPPLADDFVAEIEHAPAVTP
ncbi:MULTISPECIES: hypothetical protein [unclassified Ensifer]|uniref:hypothetical protein n=1 Tax=unclassified Ensifer TaxID=2633371 RepID=UPI00081392BE|nr:MULTISPECIES: hypothetical protein [unclassified Ensifer]OCP21337.1 hypothetical protein BC363_28115 [Ensifer sp. LC384]OCP22370.1 hypothetical protein BC361_24935 [Ensifer sp. LC54]